MRAPPSASGRGARLALVETYGHVVAWDEHWEDGYTFAVFEKKADAAAALASLGLFAHRKAHCKRIRARRLASVADPSPSPSHSFYVRWPAHYQRLLRRQASAAVVAEAEAAAKA